MRMLYNKACLSPSVQGRFRHPGVASSSRKYPMKTTAFIFDIGNVLIDFDLPRLLKATSNHSRVNTEGKYGSWTYKDTIDVETG